jgi:hypothetical protein
MKKNLIILAVISFITLTAKGQNLFFIGENSYSCSETFTLQSNFDSEDSLNVIFAKDGTNALIIVNTKFPVKAYIREKLIIYLDNGSVITCIDRGKYDYVDNIASSAYSLTNEELSKMKKSNINTIRYTIRSDNYLYLRNFSASNKAANRIDFPTILTEFFDKQ